LRIQLRQGEWNVDGILETEILETEKESGI
jgi:hypothetical protein